MIAFPQVFSEHEDKTYYIAYDPLTGSPTSWANRDAIMLGHVWGHDWLRRQGMHDTQILDKDGSKRGTFWFKDFAPPICWSNDLWYRKPYLEELGKRSA